MSKLITSSVSFAKRIFSTVIIILSLLTITSGVLLAVCLVDYIHIDDKEILLQSNISSDFDIFSVQYENESGEITVSGTDGQQVVAPGTSVEYTIRLRNTDRVALDYSLEPVISWTEEYFVPIQVRMLDNDGNYLIGDAKTWVSIKDLEADAIKGTLTKDESTEYTFQWMWDFESGDDSYDTLLGTLANTKDLTVSIGFTLYSEANMDIATNGGIMDSGLGNIIIAATTVVLSGILMAIVIIVARKNKKNLLVGEPM